MNERDSEAVAAQLVAKGYTLAPAEALADVVLLNTCSVRDAAEQRAMNKMTTLSRQFRRKRPEVVLGFLGCMAQSRGHSLIDQLPDVDLVLGTQKFHRVAEYLDELFAGRQDRIVDVSEEAGSEGTIREHLLAGAGLGKAVTAYVSIMQGCNQYCTFCIVPYTRGLERSRSIESIVVECEELVSRGVKEVTLLGQIVTSYGRRDIGLKSGRSAFVQLLDAVEQVQGLERVRFTAPHPKGYGEDLVEAYGRLSKLCPSAHLPVQSGSDRILRLMHRGYDRDRYSRIVENLRRVRPGLGITTDLIVGFPGETEADFEQTLDLVRELEFDQAYVFKYSPRKDTPAAQMPDQVPQELKEERNYRLLAVVNEVGRLRYEHCIGKRVRVLVEGPSRRNGARLEGRTGTNKLVVFEGSERQVGEILEMKVVRTGNFTLYGDPAILNLDETAGFGRAGRNE